MVSRLNSRAASLGTLYSEKAARGLCRFASICGRERDTSPTKLGLPFRETFAMSYKLYNRVGSGGFAVEAALALAGESCELVLIDSEPGTPLPASFKEINPWGQVPVLELSDGTLLTETAAILIYLSVVHPGAVGPPPGSRDHARLLRWLVFLSANIYEGILRLDYPDRFTTDQSREAARAIRQAAASRISEAFSILEEECRGTSYLLGDTLTAADLFLAMLFAWHHNHQQHPRIRALTHRVAGHNLIAPIWRRNFDHRLQIKWGRDES